MAKLKRIYSAPLVVTVAAWIGPACTSNSGDGMASGGQKATGGGATGGKGTGGTSSGGGLSGGSSSGGMGGGGTIADCPSTPEFEFSECEPDAACKLRMTCTSGIPQTVTLVCRSDGHGYAPEAAASACDRPYDSCVSGSSTYDCVNSNWQYFGGGGNPPAPCPGTLPSEGADCHFGFGFGADRPACGYPCDGAEGWTVTGCVAEGGAGGEGSTTVGPGVWTSDGACDAQGGNAGK